MRPNVLLVVLDSVRARNTSLHGHVDETTPFLESLQEEATWYTQARSPAATSLTSHASIFTGRAVPDHGLTETTRTLEPGHTVFEALQDEGYATGVFSENTWITEVDVGLNRGFDTVVGPQNLPFPDAVDPRGFVADAGAGAYGAYLREAIASDAPIKSVLNGVAIKLAYDYPSLLPEFLRSRARGDVYLDSFTRWIDDVEGPWAACVNLMDAHIPYEPSPAFDRWGGDRARSIQDDVDEQKWAFAGGHRPWWQKRALEGLYEGSIAEVDSFLEDLRDALGERGVYDDTLLVITADHGEGFGEVSHVRPGVRIAEHNAAIHEVLTHVPLVVKRPGQDDGERVEDLVSLTGFPTAVERAREDDSGNPLFVRDEPVVATAVGIDEAKQRRASQYVEDLTPYTATARAVYEETDDGTIRKFVTWRENARTVEIPDPQTSFVVAETDQGRVAEAFDGLRNEDLTSAGTEIEDLDETTKRHLEDLGYV